MALIGGGSGFIGKHLTKLLSATGYNVTTISRMPGDNRITWLDLENQGIPKNTTAVINLTGENVLDPSKRWTPGLKQNVWDSRINSSQSLVRAIQKAEVKPNVFINISGVSLYKPDDSKVYDEYDDGGIGSVYDFMSELCIEWEKAATLPQNSSCRNVKIRTGVVLGREGGMIKSLITPFRFGVGGKTGKGNQPLPWIHIDDLCKLINFSIDNSTVSGVINGVAPEIITNEQFSKAFASALRRPSLFPLPEFVINCIFGKERAVLLLQGAKVHPKRTKEFGFEYLFPNIQVACKDIVNGAK